MYAFHVWCKVDGQSSAVRLVTSWATTETAVDGLLADLEALSRPE
jgi:threonine aldolase